MGGLTLRPRVGGFHMCSILSSRGVPPLTNLRILCVLEALGGAGRLREGQFAVFYMFGRLWEAQCVVFYVPGRVWEAKCVVFYVCCKVLGGKINCILRVWKALEGSGRLNVSYFTCLEA